MEPRPLSPEGERLKAEFAQLVAAQNELTPAERSHRHFERLMAARLTPQTLPSTHPHPLLNATIEMVQRVRTNRISDEPKTAEALGIDLVLAGNTEAFDMLAIIKRWNPDFRIRLLEQAETALVESLSGKD